MVAFKPASRRTTLGVDTYFARDASYCDGLVDDQHRVVALDPSTGRCRLLLCLVVTGTTCLGAPGAPCGQRRRGRGASGDALFYDSGCTTTT